MDSRTVAALASSVVSEVLLVLLLLLFPTTTTTTTTTTTPLANYLLSTEIATFLSPSKKRQKPNNSDRPAHHVRPSSSDAPPQVDPDRPSPPPPRPIDPYKVCFHMSSSTFEWLSGLLEPLLECRDPAGSPLNLPPQVRLGTGLFRLATGSTYADIARRFNVSEPTTRFCTKQLCRVLCTNYKFWIAFPSLPELEFGSSSSSAFELPNCVGVIDCTRFNSVNESNDQEETVVAQIVVDSSSRILNIVAGFRGNRGDSRVLKLSSLYKDVEEGRLLNGNSVNIGGVQVPKYLVGDGGYPLLPWLMVPYIDPLPGSSEEGFNTLVQKVRLSGLKTIASLRNWGVLSKPIMEKFKTAVAFVGACSILHNALLMREDYSALCGDLKDYSMYDQSSQYYSLGENSVEKNASTIRSVLAADVRRVHDLNHPTS